MSNLVIRGTNVTHVIINVAIMLSTANYWYHQFCLLAIAIHSHLPIIGFIINIERQTRPTFGSSSISNSTELRSPTEKKTPKRFKKVQQPFNRHWIHCFFPRLWSQSKSYTYIYIYISCVTISRSPKYKNMNIWCVHIYIYVFIYILYIYMIYIYIHAYI